MLELAARICTLKLWAIHKQKKFSPSLWIEQKAWNEDDDVNNRVCSLSLLAQMMMIIIMPTTAIGPNGTPRAQTRVIDLFPNPSTYIRISPSFKGPRRCVCGLFVWEGERNGWFVPHFSWPLQSFSRENIFPGSSPVCMNVPASTLPLPFIAWWTKTLPGF